MHLDLKTASEIKIHHSIVLSSVEDSPPFGGKGIPFYLSQFVSILGNLYPDRGVKGPFLGMFGKMDLCKKILIQAYISLI